jgi:hypothetical protein
VAEEAKQGLRRAMKNRSLLRYVPWVLLVLLPLWLAAVAGELLDARLLQNEGVATVGRLEKPEWYSRRGGARSLAFEAVWSHEGREYRRAFNLPAADGEKFVERGGQIVESKLAMRYVPSKPELASLEVQPPDPVWVSVIIASVGLCAFAGVIVFLIYDYRNRRRR